MISMSNYKNALSKIYLSKEMEERIMSEVKKKENGVVAELNTNTEKRNHRKWLVPAGAIAIATLILAVLVVPKILKDGNDTQIQIPNPIVETEGIKELKESLSFELKVPTVMPEGYEVSDTAVIGGTLAQVKYSNGTNEITYRMAKGTEDISGDYNTYEKIREVYVNNQSVMLKGNQEGYQVATWTDGTYSYSVTSEQPLSEEMFVMMIADVK